MQPADHDAEIAADIARTVARLRKAGTIAAAALNTYPDRSPGAVERAMAEMPDAEWDTLAQLSGVRPPSPATRVTVRALLAFADGVLADLPQNSR